MTCGRRDGSILRRRLKLNLYNDPDSTTINDARLFAALFALRTSSADTCNYLLLLKQARFGVFC